MIKEPVFYTGVGSQETPIPIQQMMTRCSTRLEVLGYKLRSGGARGADTAFENGVIEVANKVIYRPDTDRGTPRPGHVIIRGELLKMATLIAADHHPKWKTLEDWQRALHTRNVFQVLGSRLDNPSKFLLCWTRDGVIHGRRTTAKTGGTGQAIRIATSYNVPVFNLWHDEALYELRDFMNKAA